jgi:hypothetical protein
MRSSLAFLLAVAAAAQTRPGSVEGVVTNAITGEPIPRARVTLAAPPKKYGASSSGEGKISIGAIEPGSYLVTAERPGFLRFRDALDIRAEMTLRDYSIQLIPEGVIQGRVLDLEGQPVEGAQVTAWSGKDRESRTTNDRGEFRFDGLPRGRYRLAAAPPRTELPPEIRTDGTREENYGNAEYPGLLDLAAGGELGNLEMRLTRAPVVRVSGVVTGAAAQVSVTAERLDDPTVQLPGIVRGGKFSIWRLAPGKYRIGARAGRMSSATEQVEVAATDIDGIELQLAFPVDVGGRIEWDGTPPENSRRPVWIEFRPPSPRQPAVHAEVQADGSFLARNIPSERYDIRSSSGYVKSVYVREREAPDGILDLSRGAPDAVVVRLSAASATVSGVVRDSKGPAIAVTVTLEPQGRPDRARRAESALDGSFTFVNVAPGTYRLFTSEDGAETVEVQESDRITRDLKAPPR